MTNELITPADPQLLLDEIKWDEHGLVPVITQDAITNEVLMFAWMNTDALELTLETGDAVYYSRSRGKLWRKGESSGHVQKVKTIRLDCDADAILLNVEQMGGIACHTGRRRCFYRLAGNGKWQETEQPLKNPESIYGRNTKSAS